MSALSTVTSTLTESTTEKKAEEGYGRIVPASGGLHVIAEDGDADEAAQVAGDVAQAFTADEEDAVRRKLDRRILPLLAIIYFSQYLDKNSINYASVVGGFPISGSHYTIIVAVFYVGFFIAEIPQSVISQRFPIARYLGVNILIWAACLTLHAASGAFAPFLVFRLLLGAFESVVAPIMIALVASFYRKEEQAKRIASFYVCNGITAILGGLIAWGISHVENRQPGREPWRILYYLFGGLAFVVGVLVVLFLPSSPATATFLSPREKVVALERIRVGQSGTISHKFKRAQAIEALTDPKTWLLFSLMAIISVPNSAITSFTSILIKSFGYTSQEALLMNMPCGAMQIITTLSTAYWADRRKARMLPFAATLLPSIVGFALLVAYSGTASENKSNKGPLLAGILLAQTFITGIAFLYSWSSSNVAGSSKRSVTNALMLVAFAGGNAAGSQAFQAADAPSYLPGKIALLTLLAVLFPVALLMYLYTERLNKRKALAVQQMAENNSWTPEDIKRESDRVAFLDLTDLQNPFFRYTS
ncbi:hypothetical protein C6P46_003267 [Rhodotorula mucilaginosa]|uniref:Major facilitator superfamily (MFS) profile domain-containing protein n=1 Tax=Rhodotorula mucilaginosa TaxID=5537 RepID=A0A9P6W4N3_RHOMI|nr:hypothetical protein C6P46_003267 [Rhodotorula mucilaginosa]